MKPIQSFKFAVAGIALLVTACAPAALASTPSAAIAAPTATDAEVAMVDATGTAAPPAQAPTELPLATTTATTLSATATNVEVAAATSAAAAAPQPPANAYDNPNSPVDLLASYYNAINRKEYQRAYEYWQTPAMSYQDFANGFSDTTAVQLIVQPPTSGEGAAGSTYVQIATVLIAQHTDGSTHTYGGCFVTRKSNLQPPDIPKVDVWHIYSAQLQEISGNINIPNQLAQSCQQ